MPLRAYGRNLIVKPDAPPKQSDGGILLPEAWARTPGTGRVISVGARVSDVKAGDRVSYKWIDGRIFKHEDVELKVLQQDEIVGIVEHE